MPIYGESPFMVWGINGDKVDWGCPYNKTRFRLYKTKGNSYDHVLFGASLVKYKIQVERVLEASYSTKPPCMFLCGSFLF